MTKRIESVFSDVTNDLFAIYDVEMVFHERLAGSIPEDPPAVWEMVARQMMRAMKVKREQIDAVEQNRRVRLYLEELGMTNIPDDEAALEKMAQKKSGGSCSRFRHDEVGIYIPSSNIKAAIKENTNILYAGERWGDTSKGPMNFVAERVFLSPRRIYLRRDGEILQESDGIHTIHGRVQGPKGKMAIITEHEYAERPTINFQLQVLKDDAKVLKELGERPAPASKRVRKGQAAEILHKEWPRMFKLMEHNGIGSHRSMAEYGCFATTVFKQAS